MNIAKRVLGKLDGVYAVASIQTDGRTHFLAASEGKGPCLMFSPPHWQKSVIWDGPGGCMSLVPVPGFEKTLLAIQKFFPIFQSHDAGIVYAEGTPDATQPWRVRPVIDIPFVHRIQVVQRSSTTYLVASSVCAGKSSQDDWSQPGAVYACAVPNVLSDEWSLATVLEGISKNHGMHSTVLDGTPVIMVSGHEGLFVLEPPERPDTQWRHQQILDHEVSDMYACDIDGDGVVEIMTIEPFHGDRLVVYKRISSVWRAIFETSMDFGHVVWAGEISGSPAVIGGSRRGPKELFLLQPRGPDWRHVDRRVLDSDVEPTQIAVVHTENTDLVLSGNQTPGEVALYEFTASP